MRPSSPEARRSPRRRTGRCRRAALPGGAAALRLLLLLLCEWASSSSFSGRGGAAAFHVSPPSPTGAGGTAVSKFLASIPVLREPARKIEGADAVVDLAGSSDVTRVSDRSSTTGAKRNGGDSSRRSNGAGGGSASYSNNTHYGNPADDPAFLRKRTASLLAITNDGTSEADDDTHRAHHRGFRPDKKAFHFLMDAWAFSSEKDAADMAIALLHQMEVLEGIDPDVRSYTKAMNAVARSHKSEAGDLASHLFRQMVFASSTRGSSVHPNTHSYTAVIEAYANSEHPHHADKWLREMVRTFRGGDASVVPTSRAFHAVILAYARSGQPESGYKAQEVMDLWEDLWKEHRVEEGKPTRYNYHALISAWANSPEPGSAHHARRVLKHMEDQFRSGDLDMQPTTVTYNTVIDAYAKGAEKRNVEDEFADQPEASSSFAGDSNEGSPEVHAEELLRRMEELYSTGENVEARPNVRSFNSVLNVWAKSGRAEGAERAQEILAEMEALYQNGNEEVRPDVHSFCTVINAWARSPHPLKADRAMNMLREMKSLYRSGNHEHLKPNVVAYNAVLNACAFCNSEMGGLSQSSRAMEMAHTILKEIEGNGNRNCNPYGNRNRKSTHNEFGVKPDQITYGTFLKVCTNHLPDCSTRQQIVEMIFQRCQREGLVGNLVLQQIKAMVADPDLYERLLGRPQYAETTMEDLPPSWWRNVVEGKGRRRHKPWS